MKPFLSKTFLLENEAAQILYEQYAAPLPILDFHNHLSPNDIATNRRFANLTEVWLDGDHYKWRAMRANGIDERYCTGQATPDEKFAAWAETVPYTLRNPLYHWTHLELQNYFHEKRILAPATSDEIYAGCHALLQQEEYRAQGLLMKMKVEVVCTTDDPADSLEHHTAFAGQGKSLKLYPSFRPDKSYSFDSPQTYNAYVDRLASAAGVSIGNLDDLLTALEKRIAFFKSLGCRSADHGLEFIWFDKLTFAAAPAAFDKIRKGIELTTAEKLLLRGYILFHLCLRYHEAGWVQQFHLGAQRNNNARFFNSIGPDAGFDSIGDFTQAQHLASFLSALDERQQLSKTILYNLNPACNEVFASMTGNFNDGITPGKIQWGPAWWFLDQKDGMEKQLNTLSNIGLLSRFVGMTTDSRSFLSFPRHEYFRRILCNIIGKEVVSGELPDDLAMLGGIVENICYQNAKTYFGF